MNRANRRAVAARSRALQSTRPEQLTRQPDSKIREAYARLGAEYRAPLEVWESSEFMAQVYSVPSAGITGPCLRLSVCRVILRTDGRAGDGITWDDLQRVKRDVGRGEMYAIEVYPRDSDVVNVANMRHLWIFDVPLDCGWFSKANKAARSQQGEAFKEPPEPRREAFNGRFA